MSITFFNQLSPSWIYLFFCWCCCD